MSEAQVPRSISSISASTILKVVGIFLALYFFYLIRDIILLLLIATIISFALTPLADWLYQKAKFPRGLSVVLVYIVFIGVVALSLSFLLPKLVADFSALGGSLSSIQEQIVSGNGVVGFLNQFGFSDSLQSFGNQIVNFAGNVFQRTASLLSGIFSLISVLVISFYLVIEQDALKDFVKTLTPPDYHARINTMVQRVQRKLGRWLIGQIALMVSIFVLTFVGLSILGVENALALSIFAGLLEIVPYIGPIISAIPAIIVGLFVSPLLALFVIILYTLIQQFENYVLVPRILGKSIGANPLVILIALLIGFRLAGILGMLISAPIVAIITVVLEGYQEKKQVG